jgi:lysophospholipase L1-like esterase
VLLAPAVDVAPPPRPVDPFAKWEKDVAAIEKRLTANPPKPGAVFFVGSSSIVKWDVKKSFPDLPVVNVGFGGSQVRDTTHFADKILLPFEPKAIVFYAGDNDLAAKRTPDQVLADFQAFEKSIAAKLPKTKIYFVSVKPSPKRWAIREQAVMANSAVRRYCAKDERLKFVDVWQAMLDTEGMPKAEIFKADELHMNEMGYEIWAGILKPLLK